MLGWSESEGRTMREIIDEQVAVGERHAAALSGFSVRQVRAWDQRGLVQPGIKRRLSDRNTVRLYAFDDLVELLVAAALLNAVLRPHQIRRVVEHLRSRSYDASLRELRFVVSGGQIYFQHPDGSWEGDLAPDQVVLQQVLDLEAIKARIRRSMRPSRERAAGHVERHRSVLGGKPVFAGTRVPVAAVEPYLARGLSDERILEAFPGLTREDLASARRFAASASCASCPMSWMPFRED
jgi:uncharacterized protein (DUF433 family)